MKRGYGAGRLWKRGPVWVLDYKSAEGRRRREVLCRSKREAEDLRVEIIGKRNRVLRGLETAPDDIQLQELKHLYLADLAARASAKHVFNVRSELTRVLGALQATTVAGLKPIDIVAFRAQVVADGRSNRWANCLVQALRAMLRWGVKMELLTRSPLNGVEKLPDGKRHHRCKRRSLDDAEIAAFLDAVQTEDEEVGLKRRRVPQHPFWRFLLDTGARYGETRLLRWADIDQQEALVCFRAEDTKSGEDRVVPLTSELLAEIQGLRPHHWGRTGIRPMPGHQVFLAPRGRPWSVHSNNANRSLRRLLEKAGIDRVDARGEKIDLHALRGSFASRMARNRVPLSETQALLGHSDPSLTSKHYVRHNLGDLRRAIETLNAPVSPRRAKAN